MVGRLLDRLDLAPCSRVLDLGCGPGEWSWTGALAEWALTEAGGADAAEALELPRDHRRGWLGGYRGRLGFLTVVLRPVGPPG